MVIILIEKLIKYNQSYNLSIVITYQNVHSSNTVTAKLLPDSKYGNVFNSTTHTFAYIFISIWC